MSYRDFTIAKCKRDLNVKIVEDVSIFPDLDPIPQSDYLQVALSRGMKLALAKSSKKFRSELIITPMLLEVYDRVQNISLFSGEEFNVDPTQGLNGVCDFLISRSPEQLTIEAPAVLIVEAKRADLNSGLGQCIAEMAAAMQFNKSQGNKVRFIYGCVSSGIAWKYLRLKMESSQYTVELDLEEYPIHPVEQTLARLCWMCSQDD